MPRALMLAVVLATVPVTAHAQDNTSKDSFLVVVMDLIVNHEKRSSKTIEKTSLASNDRNSGTMPALCANPQDRGCQARKSKTP